MKSKIIRIEKKHSAFVYNILESLEGMASYSTLDPDPALGPHSGYRDLQLWIPEGFEAEIDKILDGLRKKMTIIELSATK